MDSAASLGLLSIAEAQIRITVHPSCESLWLTCLSRSILAWIFLHQNPELVGKRSSSLDSLRILCSFPCQKSPSTNTASLYFIIDISGLPRIFFESTRNRIPMLCNALRKISSGAVSLLLIFPIIWDVIAASLAMRGYIPEWNLICSPISLASCTGTAFPICLIACERAPRNS